MNVRCIRRARHWGRDAFIFCTCAVILVIAGCGGLTGSTYETREPGGEGVMTLTFLDGETCRLAIDSAISSREFTARYTVSGNSIRIVLPNDTDEPVVLTRTGDTLIGMMHSDTITFTKR